MELQIHGLFGERDTIDEAIAEMKEHGQDTKDAEMMAKELNKNNETIIERK